VCTAAALKKTGLLLWVQSFVMWHVFSSVFIVKVWYQHVYITYEILGSHGSEDVYGLLCILIGGYQCFRRTLVTMCKNAWHQNKEDHKRQCIHKLHLKKMYVFVYGRRYFYSLCFILLLDSAALCSRKF
jgi:hypothetical protein